MSKFKLSPTDKLVRRITAFKSFDAMLASMKAGYVPTLRQTKGCDKLAKIVHDAGFESFRL